MRENRDLTFEEFSARLDGMNERCGSCKYFDRTLADRACTKHNKVVNNKSPKCDSWRYFA